MGRVIDETPSEQDLEELEMSREELAARFEDGEEAVARPPGMSMRNSRVVVDGPTGVVVTKAAHVTVAGSYRSRRGINLR